MVKTFCPPPATFVFYCDKRGRRGAKRCVCSSLLLHMQQAHCWMSSDTDWNQHLPYLFYLHTVISLENMSKFTWPWQWQNLSWVRPWWERCATRLRMVLTVTIAVTLHLSTRIRPWIFFRLINYFKARLFYTNLKSSISHGLQLICPHFSMADCTPPVWHFWNMYMHGIHACIIAHIWFFASKLSMIHNLNAKLGCTIHWQYAKRTFESISLLWVIQVRLLSSVVIFNSSVMMYMMYVCAHTVCLGIKYDTQTFALN